MPTSPKRQKKNPSVKVGFCGTEGSFSELAAKNSFHKQVPPRSTAVHAFGRQNVNTARGAPCGSLTPCLPQNQVSSPGQEVATTGFSTFKEVFEAVDSGKDFALFSTTRPLTSLGGRWSSVWCLWRTLSVA